MQSAPRARLFRRDDRDQLADLANSHLSAVIPGAHISVNTLLSSLERQPDEYIVDPWVVERSTIVVEQDQRIIAAAHLQRFADDPRVSDDYRGAGLIQWFLSVPGGAVDPAAATLMRACLAQLGAWAVTVAYADGQLPFPGVYGIPAAWPHVRRALEQGGFVHEGEREALLLAATDELGVSVGAASAFADGGAAANAASGAGASRGAGPVPEPGGPSITGTVSAVGGRAPGAAAERDQGRLVIRHELGADGVRFLASREGREAGYVEVALTPGRAERLAVGTRWAELSDWGGDPAVLRPLFEEVRGWLMRGQLSGALVAVDAADDEERVLLASFGFREISVTARGWRRML